MKTEKEIETYLVGAVRAMVLYHETRIDRLRAQLELASQEET